MIEVDHQNISLNHVFVGYLDEDKNGTKTFTTHRRMDEHYFVNFKGWGVAIEVLDFLRKHDIKIIRLKIDQKRTLTVPVHTFYDEGMRIKYSTFEAQIVLPEAKMIEGEQLLLT